MVGWKKCLTAISVATLACSQALARDRQQVSDDPFEVAVNAYREQHGVEFSRGSTTGPDRVGCVVPGHVELPSG